MRSLLEQRERSKTLSFQNLTMLPISPNGGMLTFKSIPITNTDCIKTTTTSTTKQTSTLQMPVGNAAINASGLEKGEDEPPIHIYPCSLQERAALNEIKIQPPLKLHFLSTQLLPRTDFKSNALS